MTEILIQAGADVNAAAPPAKMAEYAQHVAGAAHASAIGSSMREMVGLIKMSGSDRDTKVKRLSEVATKHASIVEAAYRRALYSSSPITEALAQGKLAKASSLIAAGASPAVDLAGMPAPLAFDRSEYLPPQDERFQQLRAQFGGIHWDGLAVPLLQVRLGPRPLRAHVLVLRARYRVASPGVLKDTMHSLPLTRTRYVYTYRPAPLCFPQQMSAASGTVSAPAMRGTLLLKAEHVVTIVKATRGIGQ